MAPTQALLDRPVFSVGKQDYRWADVVAAARAWGRWSELEQQAATAPDRPRTEGELDEAGRSFRYARNLLAADEMEGWLERWGLTNADWSRWLRHESGQVDVWVEAVCSGALAELARELAARGAAVEATGSRAGPVDGELDRMDAALAAFTREALVDAERARLLELRSSDWVRLDYSVLSFAHSGMAQEAALCVREDGLSLAEVAERAGVELHRQRSLVGEVDPMLSKPLLSTPAGELVGPLEGRDEFVLIQVHEKIAPTLADPVIQDLLDRELPRRALEREMRKRVRWHERL